MGILWFATPWYNMVYLKLWPSLGTWDCKPVNFGVSMGFIFSDKQLHSLDRLMFNADISRWLWVDSLCAVIMAMCFRCGQRKDRKLAIFGPFLSISISILISVSTSIATKSGFLPGRWETRRASSKPFSPQGQGTLILWDCHGLPHVHVEITSPRHGISSGFNGILSSWFLATSKFIGPNYVILWLLYIYILLYYYHIFCFRCSFCSSLPRMIIPSLTDDRWVFWTKPLSSHLWMGQTSQLKMDGKIMANHGATA